MPPLNTDLLAIRPRLEVSRRDALKLIAGGIAALQAGCLEQAGEQEIVPYVQDPPEARPGTIVRYASALTLDGFGHGILVETHEGRPTKLDGNPAHPAMLGGSLPWVQARILDLYDPQRSKHSTIDGNAAVWTDVARRLRQLPDGPLWIVMRPQTSPTIAWLLSQIAQRREVHVVYDTPFERDDRARGHELAFGRPAEVLPDLARADVIASLDADFMAHGPMAAAWARKVAVRRDPAGRMNRLWMCEPVQTPTGTLADETLAVPAGDVAAVLVAVVEQLATRGVAVPTVPRALATAAHQRLGDRATWAQRLADDLAAHRGAGALLVGDRQPAAVHALARVVDRELGNPARVVAPVLAQGATLDDLVGAKPASVILIDVDPLYTAPHLPIADVLRRTTFTLHVGTYRDQTCAACRIHAPLAHDLETWSDPRAADGTIAIGQPGLRPRFDVASPIDVLAGILGDDRGSRELVHSWLRSLVAPEAVLGAFEPTWTTALRTGVVAGTAAPDLAATAAWHPAAEHALVEALEPPSGIEIALAPSAALLDGRFAPNAWLQELPHPITKQTWGNAALMSPAMAEKLGVGNDDHVRVATRTGTAVLPAVIVTGAADDSITIELGYGRLLPEVPIANGVGVDVYPLRANRLFMNGAAQRAPGSQRVIRTQLVTSEHGANVAPMTRLAEFRRRPELTSGLRGDQPSLLPPQNLDGNQWGMMIDTGACTGCSACMVACQAENNIATAGPEGVARGRHMNWIRIDRYVHDDGGVVNEPMPCQHCENAPCEYVCPVNATTHSHDGLNEQVYNRCIGTRFCSNNCPYKVRRFNWFSFEREDDSALQYNPDVTVRSRGVMEKCTYCVQRIRRAEHEALVDHRPIRSGEIMTACQAACPTNAIVFGDIHETGTRFAALRSDPRRFNVLHDLGTRPRTVYLAKITNPKEPA
jgi:molybdopterin-containing oxidoreductase family iron-sulfur binding subunit